MGASVAQEYYVCLKYAIRGTPDCRPGVGQAGTGRSDTKKREGGTGQDRGGARGGEYLRTMRKNG